jgi:hypothetical protein
MEKVLIAYHKPNGIIIMKEHVELDPNTLIKKICKKI